MTTVGIGVGLLLGLVVGVVCGLTGIGGGILLVPALIYIYGMSQIKAQGTSLATLLLPLGIFAFWTYHKAGHTNLRLAMVLAVGITLGAWVGGAWAQHLSETVLRRSFAGLLIVVAIRLFFAR